MPLLHRRAIFLRMARAIEQETFDDVDYDCFSTRLYENVHALRLLLARPGFGEGAPTLGAELELSIIDSDARPLGVNRALVAQSTDPRLALELDQFNLEYNLTPVPAAGLPFSQLQRELELGLAGADTIARSFGGRVTTIGMLPTLTAEDLQRSSLTDLPRYRALNAGLQRMGHSPFEIRISGADPLTMTCADITLEGANTSFQVHLRVAPGEFAATYNAAQMATAVAVAVGANSPVFVGHRLWDETRVALFKQALDYRDAELRRWRAPARVSFGHGWVREGAHELFAEGISLFPPVFPLCGDEQSVSTVAAGGTPLLEELRLHHGTVWRWNRAIYDSSDGGHLRIEFRALPSGPTPVDMMASAAFLIGLTVGLAPRMTDILPRFPFACAEYNLYRGAQQGLDARLLWPTYRAPSPAEHPLDRVMTECLPLAEEGLGRLGVAATEIDRMLAIIRGRIENKTTGARWQRRALDALLGGRSRAAAMRDMLEQYQANVATGRPVAEWRE